MQLRAKEGPHCPCAPTLRQPMPSVRIVPFQWGQLWATSLVSSTPRDCSSRHIIWRHPVNSGSNTLKAVSVPNTRALQARCKFGNHVAEIKKRWLGDGVAQGLPFHCVDMAPSRKSTSFTFEYDRRRLAARRLATSSLQQASTGTHSCAILALLPVEEFVLLMCSHPF
jgi:hypothetical protein